MTHRRPHRGLPVAAAAVAFGLLVTGCGQAGQEADAASTPSTPSAAADSSTSAERTGERPLAAIGRAARSAAPDAEVSRPPGDPGLDAAAVPPPVPTAPRAQTEERAPRTVPARAMLSARDLRRTYGGRWRQHDGATDDCVVPEGALAERTTSYDASPVGTVTQTVASYGDIRRADAAVLDLRYAAERCGWTGVHDPRIGSAAVAAVDEQGRTMTAVAADGVMVVLVGAGRVPSGGQWDALVDLAVGSSCPAAVGGCH